MLDNVRSPTPPSPHGSVRRTREAAADGRIPQTRDGEQRITKAFHGGGSLKPVVLADSRSPPQGWPLLVIGNPLAGIQRT